MDDPSPTSSEAVTALPPLDDLPVGCVLADAAGTPTAWNAAAESLLGRELLQRSPRHWAEIAQIRSDDGQPVPATALPFGRTAVATGDAPAERLLVLEPAGRPPATLAMLPLPWADGSLTLVRPADRARRIAEAGRELVADLQRRLRRQRAIVRTAAVAGGREAAGDAADPRPRLIRLLDSVVRGLPADAAVIALGPSEGAGDPEFLIAGDIESAHAERLHAAGAGDWIARERRPLTVASPAVDPFAAGDVAGCSAWAAVPLPGVADGEGDGGGTDDAVPVGVLYAVHRRERVCDADDLAYLEAVADQAAGIVVRGRLLAALRRRTRELQAHRDHLESLVAERTADLEATHARLRVADRLAAIGTFTAGLGHDMENVLLPLRCRLDAITDEQMQTGGPLAEAVMATGTAVGFLGQLADGLRLLARDPLAPGPAAATDLEAWWAQARPLLRHSVAPPRRLEAAIAADLPPVAIPAAGLTQAVLNLVVNAADAVATDGVIRIEATAGPATAAGEAARSVRLTVRDDGRGMTPEVAAQAFDPFFSTRTRTVSTGLGLWLVHQILERAGGRIHLDTAPGVGSTFTLELPVAVTAAATDAADVAVLAANPSADGRAAATRLARIRIADPRRRAWIVRLLEDAGWPVASDPPAAGGEGSDAIVLTADGDSVTEIRLGGPPPGDPADPADPAKPRILHVPDPEDLAAIRRLLTDSPPLPETPHEQ